METVGPTETTTAQMRGTMLMNSAAAARKPAAACDLSAAADDELVAWAREGGESALEELFGRHEAKLLALAKRFVPNDYDAQEVLQDVFLTTWRKLPGFEGRAQIGTWLHRVTVNAALMFLRARSRRPRALLGGAQAANDGGGPTFFPVESMSSAWRTPDEQLQSAELHGEIQKAVDELPSGLRSVFFERLVEGRSTRQTAQALGLSTLVVRTRLHRARVLLRANIEGYRAA
jgi:RNA polymerase sigma-70 factor, ECF subfamily